MLKSTLKTFPQVVKEFTGALWNGRTYNIFGNWYCLFGILWGIPIPVVTVTVALHASALPVTLPNIIKVMTSSPFQLFFLLHPVFFGVIFGAMGTVRYNKELKLKELDRMKSNFLSMVSHELRTPLTTIQGYISFLLTGKGGTINDLQKECLGISQETADLLNRLIGDILALSKIESGEFKVNVDTVDIGKIVDKAILSRQLFADNNGVSLENRLPEKLPPVKADEERILQVITNLFDNAIKFNRRGGTVAITAPQKETNEKLQLCVADSGIGIPKDRLEKVFDKFYQVDSSGKRKYGGCGLGLAICKRIIELHRGRIWIESKLGAGSKFFFELPTA